MGCNCSKPVKETAADGSDFPEFLMISRLEPWTKFEKQFPFYRMNVLHFMAAVDKIGKENFSVKELSDRLNTKIWREKDHFGKYSPLLKVL